MRAKPKEKKKDEQRLPAGFQGVKEEGPLLREMKRVRPAGTGAGVHVQAGARGALQVRAKKSDVS